jgi:hypothetical protein
MIKTNFRTLFLTLILGLSSFFVYAQSKVQVIHNSPGAPAVDVWVDGTTVLTIF